MANYRYTYDYGGRRYEIEAPKGATAADLQAIVEGSGRSAAPAPAPAAAKPKKKKEDESFLSGVLPTLKGAVGNIVTGTGRVLEQVSPYLPRGLVTSSSLLQSAPRGSNVLQKGLERAGTLTRSAGEKMEAEAEAALPEASKQERRRQAEFIQTAKPGAGSKILAGISRGAAMLPSFTDYDIGGLSRTLLPQTPEAAARDLASVQAPFQTKRGAAEFIASQAPATLIPLGGGKAVQIGARAVLPRLGVEVSEAALAKGVGRGVVTAGGGINAASAGNQAYEDVINAGGTKEEADRAFKIAFAGAAAVSGAAARMPGLEQRVFAGQPAREGILRSAGRAVIGEAPQEFVEEGGATLATNVAKLGTAAETPIGEDVLSSGLLGAIGGATIAAPIGGLQGAFSGRDTGPTAPTSGAAQAPRAPTPPPPPPADMDALVKALGPVGGKVTLQEPTGAQEYTYQGIDEDGSVILADADGVVFSEDPDQVQAAIKAGVAEPESGLGGMAFGMDITEGLGDVFVPPPPPPPPPPPSFTEKPKFTIETAEEEATRKAEQAVRDAQRMEAAAREFAPAPSPFSPGTDKPKFTIEMPPPSPQNTERKSQVGKVIFDQENGVGQVPLNQSVNYRGFTAMMRPSKFLELAADLEAPKNSSVEYIRKAIDQGKGIGSPFLNVDFETGKVDSHDGRHRMLAILEKNGDVPVPVHIFGKGEQRARSLDAGKVSSFASSMTGEDGSQSTDNFSEAFLDEAAVPVAAPAPVQETVQETVQPEPVAPPAPPRAVGKADRATIPATREKVDVQYELQDLDNIRFAEGELQNRDRSRPQTQQFLRRFTSEFDPEGLGEDRSTDRGAPIISKDNTILSGNGRTLGLEEIYEKYPEQAEAYREFLREQGYDIEGVERPVLVRRLMSDVDERKFVVGSNEADIAALSPPEQAAQDAKDILTTKVLSKFNGGDLKAAKNDAFISAFLAELSPQQRENAMDDKGKVSAQALKRIENALLYKAYGGSGRASDVFISKAMERTDDDTKTLTNSLVDVSKDWIKFQQAIDAGEIDTKYNITNKLMETIGTVSDIKASGNSVGFELRSPDMVEPMDPFVRDILLAFHDDKISRILSRKAIAEKLRAYTEVAAVQQAEPDMLGMSETPSAREIWKRIDAGEGTQQPDMYASIQPISPKRRREILDEGGRVPSLSRGVTKLKKLWADGKIDAKEFAYEVASYSDFIEDAKNWKRWEDIGKPKVRGPDRIREELLKQKRLGRLSVEEVNFAEWFIQRNENLLGDLGIAVKKPSEKIRSSGFYDVLPRVMYLIKDRADDGTTVHEIMHHLERMMPQDIRMAIKRAWAKDLDRVERLPYDGKNDKDVMFFKAIRAFHNQKKVNLNGEDLSPSEAFKFATNLISDGDVDGRLYQYVNPSEFWAVNATEILQGRYDVQGSLLGRLKNWLRELSIKIKGLFKLDSNAPIIKALDSLAKSDGKFVSNQMLEEKPGDFSDITPISDARNRSILAKAQAVVDKGSQAKLREVEDILDALDDVYSSDDENAKKEADRLEESLYNMERQIREKSRPSNDNKLETEVEKAERELRVARQALDNLFYNDERSFKDRRTKERKAYEKELDQLEAAKDEAFAKWDKLYREQTDAMMMALTNGTAAQMRNAVAKAQERTDKIIDEGADLQKDNRGCD
jgi:hypothetical protein